MNSTRLCQRFDMKVIFATQLSDTSIVWFA
jgi:hypothetical protein